MHRARARFAFGSAFPSLVVASLVGGCSNKEPATVVVFLDSSASFASKRPSAAKVVRDVSVRLRRHLDDRIIIYRLSQRVFNIYSGPPLKQSLNPLLEAYTGVGGGEKGTAYGLGLKRAVQEAVAVGRGPGRLAMVFLGDGEDEAVRPSDNISWDSLPALTGQIPANAMLAFLFINPQRGDLFRHALSGILGDRLVLLPPELATGPGAVKSICAFIGR